MVIYNIKVNLVEPGEGVVGYVAGSEAVGSLFILGGDSCRVTEQCGGNSLTECAKLLRYTSNNVNQIARRVNSGGGVYPDEVDEINVKLTEISGLFGNILEQLSKIK